MTARLIPALSLFCASIALAAGTDAKAASNVLTWSDNSTNEASFNIERKAEICTGTMPFAQIATVPTNTVTYTDSAVVEGITYCYRVSASNATGVSAYSNTGFRTVPFTIPAPPSGLGVSAGQ